MSCKNPSTREDSEITDSEKSTKIYGGNGQGVKGFTSNHAKRSKGSPSLILNLGVATPLGVAATSLKGRLEILCTY